jgi:hypothetical protein
LTPERPPGAPYAYRPEILETLWRYGVHPTPHTPPEVVHAFVGDLHRYELRRLRDRLLNKEFPKPEYYSRVVSIRNRYRILALKPHQLVLEARG